MQFRINILFIQGGVFTILTESRSKSIRFRDRERPLENQSKSNSTDITYSTVIESMIALLKSRFENCPDFKLQERWEIRIQKMASILG